MFACRKVQRKSQKARKNEGFITSAIRYSVHVNLNAGSIINYELPEVHVRGAASG